MFNSIALRDHYLKKNTQISYFFSKASFLHHKTQDLTSTFAKNLSSHNACVMGRSEGFPRTGYLIPVRDGAGAWTFGNLRLPPFKHETRMFLKHTNGQ